MALGFFNIKKRQLSAIPPPPPEELPVFPSPRELEKASVRGLKEAAGVMARPSLEEFKSTVVAKERHELGKHEATKPIFLKMHSFKAVMDELGQVRTRLNDADTMLASLEDLHKSQDMASRKWQDAVKDMHQKLIFVDEMLFKRR